MKAIYWRPQTTSPRALLAIGITSSIALAWLFLLGGGSLNQSAAEVRAARLAQDCFQAIKAERLRLGHAIDERFDPHRTGMIGEPISASTSKVAPLSAKQLSVNPNFAAAVVRMLQQAGVERGDTIAVGWTGSFPALNVALSAAIEAMELNPIVVSSALSSQYGANIDDFLWLDMEQHLAQAGLIHFRTMAMTIGGAADRAMGASTDAKDVALRAQQRTNVGWLDAAKLSDSIDARMELYARRSLDRPIAAYVNVGGGVASMGGEASTLRSGVNFRLKSASANPDCVAARFASQKNPIIHLAHARSLAESYGLNTDLSQLPAAGVGAYFDRRQPSRCLAALLLAGITMLLHAFVLRSYGYHVLDRVLAPLRRSQQGNRLRLVGQPAVPQLMV